MIFKRIKQMCNPDYYEIGFASLKGLLPPKFSKYGYGLSLVRKLDDRIIDEIYEGPTKEYYSLYHSINDELNKKTEEIAALLRENNIDTVSVKSTVKSSELDEKNLKYPISHKMAATRAGLGWIGKTDLLITERFGARVRLASVLLTKQITGPGTPATQSRCGTCNVCVVKCPAQAANGRLWTTETAREDFYNPFKCRDFCQKISKKRMNVEASICGICVSVCPKGKTG